MNITLPFFRFLMYFSLYFILAIYTTFVCTFPLSFSHLSHQLSMCTVLIAGFLSRRAENVTKNLQ